MRHDKYTLLDNIETPADLKKLSINELPKLCEELRDFIIHELAHNPGHLGASLGVIEMTVALHYVFDTPNDRLVWDVGHQAYAHKILTGRKDRFHTNRQFKGLSGFPTPKESEYDAFGVGHSSTSISAALGLSIATKLKGENRQVVAIIGDGALTGGLAFEGLNNASCYPNNLLVILNDNNMAIDPVRGGISDYLVNIQTSKTYNQLRYRAYNVLKRLNIMNESRRGKIIRFANSLKALRSNSNNIFEGLNMRYFGPVNGHDIAQLVEIFQELKNHKGPKVLHCITKKGKGYKPAEEEATTWHAPGIFNPETGVRKIKESTNTPPLYQDVFGHTLVELAELNDKIVGITPAMPSGCSMNFLFKEMPRRAFDVGIAEGHAVTFSAGLAKEGLMPFCNIYSSFMQRAYDNVIHDVALQQLNVVFCIDRAGIVGNDGATHQGQFDLAYFRCIPQLTIAAPLNEIELRHMMYTSQLPNMGPFVIRYPRGNGMIADWRQPMEPLAIGKGRLLHSGNDVAFLTLGHIGNTVTRAIALLAEHGISAAHYDMRFLKPLDDALILEAASRHKYIVTVEDGTIKGGLGSAVLELLSDHGLPREVKRIGLPDEFIEHGSPAELYNMLGLDAEGISSQVEEWITR